MLPKLLNCFINFTLFPLALGYLLVKMHLEDVLCGFMHVCKKITQENQRFYVLIDN